MRRRHKAKKIISKEKTVFLDKTNRNYVLKKTDLGIFLSAILGDFLVIGAKAKGLGDYLFSYLNSPEELILDYPITTNTAKDFLFPRQEELFKFKRIKRTVDIQDIKLSEEKQTVFFGLHSCDIRAVNFHDYFFGQNPRDTYYWQRRNQMILISLACNNPLRNSCFCNVTSLGPFLEDNEDFDIQLIDLGLLYLVECKSIKGLTFVKRHKQYFHKSVEANLQERQNVRNKSLKGFSHHYDLRKLHKRLTKEDFSRLWQGLGLRCQNCAGCEFICPTCFCFYTQDTPLDSTGGIRERRWDSCTFCGFSQMAQGNNPYAARPERISRRFYCKLFNTYKWSGMFGCVGCGRCSYVCPVNLDMESFIVSLSGKAKDYKPLLKEL